MTDPPRERVVLLGASNLWLSFRAGLAHLRARAGAPLDVLATPWPGRSYGLTTRVLGRELPSLSSCGLWRALDARAELPTSAIVLDPGNDLAYGVDSPVVADWIATVVATLAERGARGAIVRPPLRSLEKLGKGRFRVTKALFFPGRAIERDTVVERTRDLDARLVEVAAARRWKLVEPPGEWFGLDPIHWRRSRRHDAWRAIVASLDERAPVARDAPHGARPPSVALDRRPRFEAEVLLGRPRCAPQPSARASDGTIVSWF